MQTYVTTGKWILAGEHSVLRGSRAMVFPLPSMQIKLIYDETTNDFVAQFQGTTGSEYQILFYGLVDRALEILGRSRSLLRGSILLDSNLPLGNGLGASAALCTAVGLWLADLGWVDRAKLESFCRELENMFHGESSGVDIAVVLSGRPLWFSRFAPSETLSIAWKPNLFLSSSGQKGLTHSCVLKVKEYLQKNPTKGQKYDEEMGWAAEKIKNLLQQAPQDESEALNQLVLAIDKARSCFEAWGLTEGVMNREMNQLLDLGARAVKPTGSGGGGYILSLWDNEPPESVRSQLISCW